MWCQSRTSHLGRVTIAQEGTALACKLDLSAPARAEIIEPPTRFRGTIPSVHTAACEGRSSSPQRPKLRRLADRPAVQASARWHWGLAAINPRHGCRACNFMGIRSLAFRALRTTCHMLPASNSIYFLQKYPPAHNKQSGLLAELELEGFY